MVIIAILALPSDLMTLLAATLIEKNKFPAIIILPYSRAEAKIPSVAPKANKIGSIKTKPTIVKIIPKPNNKVTILPNTFSASSFLFSPIRIEIIEAPPIPNIIDKDMIIIEIGNTIAIPAIPMTPTPCPTKIVSTKLYKAETNIPTIAGADNFHNNLLIFSSPNNFFCFSIK